MSAIEQKIAKLLRLAESSNPHEAELAQAQAERLMVKWGIEQAVIQHLMANDGKKASIPVVEKHVNFSGTYAHAMQLLANAVASGYGTVQALVGDGWDAKGSKIKRIFIIGHEDEVDRCITLINSLVIQANVACIAWWKERERDRKRQPAWGDDDYDPFGQRLPKLTPMEAFKARRQFILAFGNACWKRITEMRASVMAEVKKEHGDSTELALRDRKAEVDEFMARRYPNVKQSNTRLKGSREGSRAGSAAGHAADIGGTQIGR